MTSDPDEITTDVDPSWVASIRAGRTATRVGSGSRRPTPAPSRAAPEATGPRSSRRGTRRRRSGVSDGLLERIRQEIGTPAPPAHRPARIHPPPAAPPVPASPTPAPPELGPTDLGPATDFDPEAGARRTVDPRDDDARSPAPSNWRRPPSGGSHGSGSPRRHRSTRPPSSRRRPRAGIDRTKVAIAAIAAIAVVVVAWLFIGSRGGDDAPPPDRLRADVGGRIGRGSAIPADPDDGARWLMTTGVRRGDPPTDIASVLSDLFAGVSPIRSAIADWAAGTAVGHGAAREPGRLGPT